MAGSLRGQPARRFGRSRHALSRTGAGPAGYRRLGPGSAWQGDDSPADRRPAGQPRCESRATADHANRTRPGRCDADRRWRDPDRQGHDRPAIGAERRKPGPVRTGSRPGRPVAPGAPSAAGAEIADDGGHNHRHRGRLRQWPGAPRPQADHPGRRPGRRTRPSARPQAVGRRHPHVGPDRRGRVEGRAGAAWRSGIA